MIDHANSLGIDVSWPELETTHAAQVINLKGRVDPHTLVKIVVKVIPGDLPSNVYELHADDQGDFVQSIVIPNEKVKANTETSIVVSARGTEGTSWCSYRYT